MDKALIIRGRLTGPKSIELEEPISQATERLEVILRAGDQLAANGSVVDFLRALPPGQRSKADIDRELHGDRDNWDRNGGVPSK